MSLFDELFDPRYMFDNEHRQRRDIETLRMAVEHAPDLRPTLLRQSARIDRLEMLCKALVELTVIRGIATRAELSVIMQQLDLADGVEDGKIGPQVREQSPRCKQCDKFLNPRRDACIYCGAAIADALGSDPTGHPSAPPPREVSCGRCQRSVLENETYFTASGLVCEACFDPSMV